MEVVDEEERLNLADARVTSAGRTNVEGEVSLADAALAKRSSIELSCDLGPIIQNFFATAVMVPP